MAVAPLITEEIPAYVSTAPAVPAVASWRARLLARSGRWWNSLGALTRLMLTFGAALTVLFILLLALSHGMGYRNDAFLALITPPARCAMPCWNGIQPGVTTVDEAVALLEGDSAVADLRVSSGQISWWWTGEQVPLLDSTGRAFHGRMETATVNGAERVTSIVLDTTVKMGDVRLTLGEPDSITLYTVQPPAAAQRAGIVYVAHYDGLTVFTTLMCPMSVDDFWRATGYLAFGEPNLTFDGEVFQSRTLPTWFFRDTAPGCSPR